MKRILIALTILLTSTTIMAKSEQQKAVDAIEKVVIMKAKQKLNPYKNVAIKKIVNRLNNRFGNDGKPSPEVKAVGALVKSVKELVSPQYTIKGETSETKIKVLEWKSLKIDYKAKDSDLKFNFETNGKKTKFGLGMSF